MARACADSLAARTESCRAGVLCLSDLVTQGFQTAACDPTLSNVLERLPGVRMVELGALGSFVSPQIGAWVGNAVRLSFDGVPFPSKDYRGPDFNDIPLPGVSEVRVDRASGRIDLGTSATSEARPLTQVRVQRGSRALDVTSVVFSERLSARTDMRVGGLFERGSDPAHGADFEQQTYTAHARRMLGPGRLDLSLVRLRTSGVLPRSTAWSPEIPWKADRRVLRHWGALKYESPGLSAWGWGDVFEQRLDCARRVDRKDRIFGVSAAGRVVRTDRHVLSVGAAAEDAWYDPSRIRERSGRVYAHDMLSLTRSVSLRASGQLEQSDRHREIWQAGLGLVRARAAGVGWELGVCRDARYPTFDEEFGQGFERGGSTFVVELSPERRTTVRAACAARAGALRASGHIFADRVEDWIGPVAREGGPRYQNREGIRVVGSENALSWDLLAGVSVAARYDWARVEADDSLPVLHWPEHRASLSVTCEAALFAGKLGVSLSVGAVLLGERLGATDTGATVKLEPASLLDGQVEVRVMGLAAYYGLDNALDESSAGWSGYPREGRAFRWGMQWDLWD